MSSTTPRICCLDLDTFFVSVERLLDPSLVGKPVIVGGKPGQRGVVTAASYEVRAFGVHSGMSLTDAARRCPHALFLHTRHGAYLPYSRRVRQLIARFSPVVQIGSIDEFYLDLTGCERLYRRPDDPDDDRTIHRAVRRLTAAISEEIGLPSSVGIATSKPVCKIASGLAKPAGVLLVPAGLEADFLAPLPVRKFPGIGPVAEQRLHARGVLTLGQLAALPEPEVRRLFGAWAGRVQRGARGQGDADLGRDRPAFQEHDPSRETVGSISNERTFREDMGDPRVLEAMLCGLSERVCWRARRRGVKARTVTLKLRYADFDTITRSCTVAPTSSELELFPLVKGMYQRHRTRATPIRLLGVTLSNLGMFDEQLRLFAPSGVTPAADSAPLHQAVDHIRGRFGYRAIGLAPAGKTGCTRAVASHLDQGTAQDPE